MKAGPFSVLPFSWPAFITTISATKKPGLLRPGYASPAGDCSNAAYCPDDQRHDEEGQEKEKQDLSDPCRSPCNTGKAKYAGNNCNHKEQKRVIKHDRLLSLLIGEKMHEIH
jgi:hypothetical protein